MALKLSKKILKMSSQEVILGVLFVIYFVLGYPLPEALADLLDSVSGKLIVAITAILLLLAVNPIVGILGVLVAVDLLRKAGETTGSTAKAMDLNKFNQFPYTLEQEMVNIRTVKQPAPTSAPVYKPVLEDDHNASPINKLI